MNLWWLFAIISGAGLATRNLLFKSVNTKVDVAFSALILAIGMTAVTVIYYVIQRASAQEPMWPTSVSWQAIVMCLIAGAGVAFANIFLAIAYKAGGYASLVAILQNGFSIVVTIVLGYLLLAEVIKPMQFLGILVTFMGMVLITRG